MIAKVLVQTPISAIEEIYDYKVPENLLTKINFGQLVEIPFRNRITTGLVIATEGANSVDSPAFDLKEIKRVLGDWPVIDLQTYELVKAAQVQYGGSLWQILNQAIPSVAMRFKPTSPEKITAPKLNIDQEFKGQVGDSDFQKLNGENELNWAVIPPNGCSVTTFLQNLIVTRSKFGQVLVLVPDDKELKLLEEKLIPIFGDQLVSVNSNLNRTDKYQAHLQILGRQAAVIIGTRSATFSPISNDATVIIYDEQDESFWEKHSPGWNSRTITLLRHKCSRIIVSPSLSLEIGKLIESETFELKNYSNFKNYQWVTIDNNRSFNEVVRKGLEIGHVLVSIAEKGYANMFVCNRCRNRANCDCGGKLIINKGKHPNCNICAKEYRDWKCSYCGESRPYVLRKGADRTTEEIGKIFPKIPIHLSTGTKRIDTLKREKTNSIIIATPGAEPEADYGAVVLLDGEIQFNRTQLRADEVARLRWRKNIWQVIEGGYIYSSLPNSHQFIQDIYINNEQRYFSREISNRKIAKLPPSYGIAKITGATRDLLTFAANLREGKANLEVLVSDVREVEASTGTTPLESTVIIRFQKKFQPNVVSLLNEVNQVRMLKKKTAFSIMIDGYDLI